MSFLVTRGKTLSATFLLLLSLTFTGCGKGDGKNIKIAGVTGPTLSVVSDGLLISMVFENIDLNGGLRYPVPEYENSYLEVAPDLQSGGTLLAFYVSYLDVYDNQDYLTLLDPQTLPGGRPIPGLISGKLPAVAFSIPDLYDMGFYLGNKVYGLWVPVDFGLNQIVGTFRFYESGRRVGNISVVGKDANGENSGFFLALDLNSKTAKWSKKKAKKM